MSLILTNCFSAQGLEKGAHNSLSTLSSAHLLLKVEIWIYENKVPSA